MRTTRVPLEINTINNYFYSMIHQRGKCVFFKLKNSLLKSFLLNLDLTASSVGMLPKLAFTRLTSSRFTRLSQKVYCSMT